MIIESGDQHRVELVDVKNVLTNESPYNINYIEFGCSHIMIRNDVVKHQNFFRNNRMTFSHPTLELKLSTIYTILPMWLVGDRKVFSIIINV